MHPIVVDRQPTPQGLATPTRPLTEQTVRKMCEHIRNAQSDPLLQWFAKHLSIKTKTPADHLSKIWLFVKSKVRFAHDEKLIRDLLNDPEQHFELLISPPVLIRMDHPRGDCDDFTMLVLALAQLAGFQCGIVTIMCDRKRTGEYSHVYGCAVLPGILAPLDCSHGKYPGWEVPRHDIQRKTIWDLNGNVISDEEGPAANQSSEGLGTVPPGLPSFPGMPVLNTDLPIIGTLDFQNPLEWLTLGGAAASALFVQDMPAKLAGVAGFLGARYLLSQMWGAW